MGKIHNVAHFAVGFRAVNRLREWSASEPSREAQNYKGDVKS